MNTYSPIMNKKNKKTHRIYDPEYHWSARELRLLFIRYLYASYWYYEALEDGIWSDNVYDRVAKILYNNFDRFEHQHKHIVDKRTLKAGSGYDIVFPPIVKHSAHLWKRDVHCMMRLDSQ